MVYKIGSRGEAVKLIQAKLNCIPDGIFGKITDEAVRAFQKAHNLSVDGIVGEKTLKALKLYPINTRKIDYIIVHCTATKPNQDWTVDDIRRCHVKERGFSDIGYHYVIYRDGSIHPGRPESQVGAHCLGYNSNSLGVVTVSGIDSDGKPADTRTDAQKEALRAFLKELKKKYPSAKIRGHRDFAAKACPSYDATSEFSDI